MKQFLITISIFLLAFLIGACSRSKSDFLYRQATDNRIKNDTDLYDALEKAGEDPYDMELNNDILYYMKDYRTPEELIDYATGLYKKCNGRKHRELKTYACVSLFYAYYFQNNTDSAGFYLEEARKNITPKSPFFGIIQDYSADFSLKFKKDYPKAMNDYKNALEWYQKENDYNNTIVILTKISSLYLLKRDTSGIKYADMAYGIKDKSPYNYIKCLSILSSAQFDFFLEKYGTAKKKTEEAISIAKSDSSLVPFLTEAYTILADIYYKEGNMQDAESNYRNAILYKDSAYIIYNILDLYLNYGNFLLSIGKYDESIDILENGLGLINELSDETQQNRHHFLLSLSNVYTQKGDDKMALSYLREYNKAFEATFGNYTEKEFNQVFADYEKEKIENGMKNKIISLNRTIYIISSVFGIILIVLAYMAYRRKNKMYQTIVEQHQQYIKKIEDAKNSEMIKSEEKNKAEYELFMKIESLMKEKRLYRSPDISREKLADMLDSNITYISTVVNKYAKVPFYTYINTYRITDAISLLSESGKKANIKSICYTVGYKSITSFYRAFQREVGCTPMIYIEKLDKIREKETEEADN